MTCFLLFTPQTKSLPFESANHIIFFLFVVAETLFGLYAIMLMVREQTNRFRIRYLIQDIPAPVHYAPNNGFGDDEDEEEDIAQ